MNYCADVLLVITTKILINTKQSCSIFPSVIAHLLLLQTEIAYNVYEYSMLLTIFNFGPLCILGLMHYHPF